MIISRLSTLCFSLATVFLALFVCSSYAANRKEMANDLNKVSNEIEYEKDSITMVCLSDTLSLSSCDTIVIVIKNNTRNTIMFGEHFDIKYLDGDNWIDLPFSEDISFIDIGYELVGYEMFLDNSRKMTVHLSSEYHNYKQGKYRIVKKVSSGNQKHVIYSEFVIK